ncbi:caspase family protein [Streptomyces sp. HUAS MG47]|uniref:caspase family protein n=1 Tax=Streptomyces solicamelliae TaxID=3231716 RepID=UPI00387796E9
MTEETKAGRRFLITIGVSAYRDGSIADLPGVPHDVRRVRELLLPMGYEHVLAELAEDPTAAEIAEAVEEWRHDADPGPEDVVVVYFAGHGVKPPADRHYLLGSTARSGRTSAALAAEDLARPLMHSELGHLLVVLDTCYAGAGAGEISALAAELARTQRVAAGRWVLASARGKEQAKENVFVDALTEVVTQPQAGGRQEYLGVREITERVNRCFTARKVTQHVSHSTVDSDGHAPFFRNLAHIPGLPADDLDVETLTRLRSGTRGHFEARARGLEHRGERGDYFTGREAALAALTGWLDAEHHDRKARVVTGDPGSGKSALLGRLLLHSEDRTIVPLHARRATLEELAADLAAALRLPAGTAHEGILEALGARVDPVAVLVDALDEAGTGGDSVEADRIARTLLRPMSTMPAVRLVIGTRRPQLQPLGKAVEVIDLDDPQYVTDGQVAAYAAKLLLDAQDPQSLSPYRERPEEAETVARGIAARARRSFLVARMTARALVEDQTPLDTSRVGWEKDLPSDAREAFAAYLDRFGEDRAKVRRLLRPLAYAQGAGLPWSTVWAPLAEALSGHTCPQDDLRWLHERAGSYVVETTDTQGGSAYRLFHETMADHLRDPGQDAANHRAVAEALLALVPSRDGVRDWAAAHPYAREHLATHAAAGGTLSGLLGDVEYLVHAGPAHLNAALRTAPDPEARRLGAIYRASLGAHLPGPTGQRRDILAVDAARYGDRELSAAFAGGRGWRLLWATGGLVHPALHSALEGTTSVDRLACTVLDGRPHAVVGGELGGGMELWDLSKGVRRAELAGHDEEMTGVACLTVEGVPHAVSVGKDRALRVWDLAAGTELSHIANAVQGPAVVACALIEGRLHAVTGCHLGVRVWDLSTGVMRAELADRTRSGEALACTTIDGMPHVVAALSDGPACVWNLVTSDTYRDLGPATSDALAVACTEIDGRPHAVTGDTEGLVHLWDLTTGAQRAAMRGHKDWVQAVDTTELDGRPHAVTTGDDRTVCVWDLTDGSLRAQFTGLLDEGRAIGCAVVDGRSCAVTANLHSVQIWDLVQVWDLPDSTRHPVVPGHDSEINGLACTTLDGRPHVVSAGDRDRIRVWDLATGRPGPSLPNENRWEQAVACALVDGRPHVVTGDMHGSAHLWDLTTRAPRTLVTDARWVGAVACATIEGQPHAVVGSHDRTVRVFDLRDGRQRLELKDHQGEVRHLVCIELDGAPHAVTSSGSGPLCLWSLTDDSARPEEIRRATEVVSMAPTELQGRPRLVTADRTGTVHLWDLATRTRAALTEDVGPVSAVACATLHGRPHAVLVVDDRTLQTWDLEERRLVDTFALPLDVTALAAHGSDLAVAMESEVVVLTRASVRRPS